ncbi:MAG: hypothetical protein ACREF4_14260 [Gammaproteobacteria bacterium]
MIAVVALAATNLVGVILFGTVYALAGARRLSQTAFVACLVLVFGLVTALWVRTEARHAAIHPLGRLGRGVAGLLAVMLIAPAAVLMPLFWLDEILPREVGFSSLLGPVMALVLISLALVALTNLVGALIIAGRAALGRSGAAPG